jgi:hypothetical protein
MKFKAIVGAAMLLSACQDNITSDYTSVTVIHDVTDSLVLNPEANAALSLYAFQTNRYRQAKFRFVLLTDKLLNPTQEITMDDGHLKEGVAVDAQQRDNEIYSFYGSVKSAFSEFEPHYNIKTPQNNSECYATICSELHNLAKSTASQKYLLIYSDLMDNGTLFNSYSKKNAKLISDNPAKVGETLNKAQKLPKNMRGITVMFLYQPAGRQQDIEYNGMLQVYTSLLQSRGATVRVFATNNF